MAETAPEVTVISARVVAVEEMTDLNTLAVVFAEREDGSGGRLELQRALSFDEQDRAEGMDTYCLSMSSGATHYGGVLSWSLTPGTLELTLSREAAVDLGLDELVQVAVQMAPELALKVRDGLRRVLAEVPPHP